MYTKYKRLVGTLLFFALFMLCTCGVLYYYLFVYPPSPADRAIPLSIDVATDLCLKLEIPDTDRRCRGNAEVYERDFYPDFRKLIDEGELQTLEEWEEKFGNYQEGCEELLVENEDGVRPIRCTYNFNEEKIYFINVEFVSGTLDIIFFLAPDFP